MPSQKNISLITHATNKTNNALITLTTVLRLVSISDTPQLRRKAYILGLKGGCISLKIIAGAGDLTRIAFLLEKHL